MVLKKRRHDKKFGNEGVPGYDGLKQKGRQGVGIFSLLILYYHPLL